MKVAIVMPLAEMRGGGEQMLLDLIRDGRSGGVEWLVVFLEEGSLVRAVRDLGVDARVIPSGRLRQAHRWAATITRLASLGRREGVDLFFGWMWKAHLYAGPAAIMAGRPAAWFQLGEPAHPGRSQRLATLIPARGIVTLSKAGQLAQASIRPRRDTPLVYPGVSLERFDPETLPSPHEARRLLGLPSDARVVGIVGRLQRWKGIHVLIEAMPDILAKHPDAFCVVVGGAHDLEPDYSAHIGRRIDELGVGGRCYLAGLRADVPLWVQAMDVFVHASDNEPFGIVTIEAMALGKPVVAADRGGPTEIVTDGVDGLLTPYGDARALARGVLRYLDDPAFAARVGRSARARALEFSTERYAMNLIAALEQLSRAPRRGGPSGEGQTSG